MSESDNQEEIPYPDATAIVTHCGDRAEDESLIQNFKQIREDQKLFSRKQVEKAYRKGREHGGDSSTTCEKSKSLDESRHDVEPPKPEPDAWKVWAASSWKVAKKDNTIVRKFTYIPAHERKSKEPLYSSETINIGEELDERIKLALEEKEKADEDSWEEKRSIVRINSYEMAVRKLKKLEEVFSE